MKCAIGVDLGGTHLRAALVDESGAVLAHQRVRTLAHEGADAVLGRMLDLIRAVADAGQAAVEVCGVGIAAPGPTDPQAGIVMMTPNLPGWENFPLRARMEAHLPWPIVIGNDANLAAVGEWRFGGGRGMRNLIYVTLSTGIGGGIISDGRLLLGHRGLAGEIGHIVLQFEGPTSGSAPVRGSWEALASGTALARNAAEALRSGTPTLLSTLATPESVSTHDIDLAAQQGDALAQELITRAGLWCGVGFVTLLHLFSPEAIFIGGGVSNLGERLLGPARAEIQSRAIAAYRDVPLIPTRFGDNIGLLGAAAYAFDACCS